MQIKKYVLTAYDAEDGILTFTEQLAEDAPEGTVPAVVKVTKDNAAVMRYIMNPNEKPSPEASITNENGQNYLVIAGRNIFLGTIEAIKVVAGYSGEVILGVKSDEEGYMNLLRYDVQNDKFDTAPFAKVTNGVKTVVLDNVTYLIDNIIEEVPQMDENGKPALDENDEPVTKPFLIKASLYVYCGNGCLNEMNPESEYDVDEDDEEYDGFTLPIESIRLVEQGTRKDLAIVFVDELDDDGYLVPAKEATIQLYRANDFAYMGSFKVADPEAKIYLGGSFKKAPIVTIKDSSRILIRDSYGVKTVTDSAVVAGMTGYNYFCGTEVKRDEGDNEVVTFTYANKDMDVKSFSMTKTDRGIMFALV